MNYIGRDFAPGVAVQIFPVVAAIAGDPEARFDDIAMSAAGIEAETCA